MENGTDEGGRKINKVSSTGRSRTCLINSNKYRQTNKQLLINDKFTQKNKLACVLHRGTIRSE